MIVAVILQGAETAAEVEGITPGALAFMLISMLAVAGLTAWCFTRILRTRKHFDPDGTGPAHPQVPGEAETPGGT